MPKERYRKFKHLTHYVIGRTVREQLFEARKLIAQHRFAIERCHAQVWGCDYVYTVGLTAQELPELIILGVPYETGEYVLAEVARQSLRQPFRSGDTWPVPEELRAHPDAVLRLSAVEQAQEASLVLAKSMYREKFRVLQVVWPDLRCRYPEDEGWAEGKERQPLLPASSRPLPMGVTRWTREE